MASYGETSGSTDAVTLSSWYLLVGLTLLIVAFISAVWFPSTFHLDYVALDGSDHDPSIADADLISHIGRLPVHTYRGSSSSETPAALYGSQGDLTSSILSDLPSTNRALTVFDEVELTCTVCQQQVLHHEVVKTLPCIHQFHSACIDEWLRLYRNCPLCRNRLETPTASV